MQPTPVFLPGESQGRQSLVGYRPWGRRVGPDWSGLAAAAAVHTSNAMLKILQARLQQYVNHELQMFKLVLDKVEEPETKLPTSTGSLKKQ